MKRASTMIPKVGAMLGLLCLIFDSKCAVESAAKAIDLCLKTVIPSLFPMFVLSCYLLQGLGTGGKFASQLESMARLPAGSGGIYLIGLLGGFPVGAQSIAQAVSAKRLSRQDGERMLGFCNNCSPAFLFGIAGHLFGSIRYPAILWLIQAECSLMVALLWANQPAVENFSPAGRPQPVNCISRAVSSMVSVCSWIILAGVCNGFLSRWLYPLMPGVLAVFLSGVTELTSGVLALGQIPQEPLRLILCSMLLNFGGLCVALQVRSIASVCGLSVGAYLAQKCVQALLGGLLAAGVWFVGVWLLPASLLVFIFLKNLLEKNRETVYNSTHKGGFHHAVP